MGRYGSVVATHTALPILHLSLIAGGDLRDGSGGTLGHVADYDLTVVPVIDDRQQVMEW